MLCFDSASNYIMYMLYDYMYMQEILLSFLNLNILCITIYFITCVLHLCKCCFSVSDECKLNETCGHASSVYKRICFVFYEWSMLVVLSLITLCAMQ